MQQTLADTDLIKSLLGHNRHYCAQILSNQGIDNIKFGHWLAIPSQHLLLVFRHQQCIAFDYYEIAA